MSESETETIENEPKFKLGDEVKFNNKIGNVAKKDWDGEGFSYTLIFKNDPKKPSELIKESELIAID